MEVGSFQHPNCKGFLADGRAAPSENVARERKKISYFMEVISGSGR
jgi:hypothetical protein